MKSFVLIIKAVFAYCRLDAEVMRLNAGVAWSICCF